MATILERLQAEKRAQDEEEARPPIRDVESGRALIAETKPSPSDNVTLEMCVLRIEEFEKLYRLEVIDRDLETQGEVLLDTFDSLDLARRSKFIFQLTIWKNHNADLNCVEYRRGFSYRFEKVHSLRLLYGNPAGSMQIRQRLRADPLPALTLDKGNRGAKGHIEGSSHTLSSDESPSTLNQDSNESAANVVLLGTREIPVVPISTSTPNVTTKRNLASGSSVVVTKKTRRSNGKALCFESPVQLRCTEDGQ